LVSRPFLAVTAATFAFFMYVGVLVPLVPKYIEDELRSGELGIGLAIAAFAGVAIAVRPLIGYLVIRFGRRAVMIGGAALAAVAGSAYGFVDSLPALLALRGLTGAGEAALFVAAMTLIADLSPADRRAEAASYFSVAVWAGIGIGPVVGELILHGSGYRTAFGVAGLFAAASALVAFAVPRRIAFPSAGAAVGDVESGAGGEGHRAGSGRWLHPAAIGPGIVLAIGMAAYAAFTGFLPEYSRSLGMSGSGALFAVYSAVCLVLRIAGARLPERLGARVAVTTAFAMLGIGMALLAAIPEIWALWIAAVCIGFGAAFMYPSLVAFTINRSQERDRPRAISSFTMFFEAGTAAGGLALGGLAESFGKRSAFAAAVGLCVIGAWLLRTVVIPAASPRARDEPVASIAPLAAVSTDLR
jgi:MFS family permease